MRALILLVLLVQVSSACGLRASGRPDAVPPDPPPPAEGAAAASDEPEAEVRPVEGTGMELDFSDDVVEPQTAVEAQPTRRPVGAFELCGDKCRDDITLKQSFEDDDPPPPRSRRERRRARRDAK